MNNEKSKSIVITFEAGKTVVGDEVARRPWHKPTIKRIDLQMTMFRLGSGTDSASIRV